MLTEKIFSVAQAGAEGILWLLILLSILSLGMIFERFFTLKKIRTQSENIRQKMMDSLQSNDLKQVEDLSKERETLEGRALNYGMRHISQSGSKGLSEIFNTFALLEKPLLERNLNFLATVGSNAPFIGLLGTVLEIMKAISAIGTNQGDMSQVIVGIAGALVATAVGLMVAIPAVIAYNYFQKQVKQTQHVQLQ